MRAAFPEHVYTVAGMLSILAVPALIAGSSSAPLALDDFEKYLSYEAAALAVFALTRPRHAMFGGFAFAISLALYMNIILINASKSLDASFGYFFVPFQLSLAVVAGFVIRAMREFQNGRRSALCFLETFVCSFMAYYSPIIFLDLWNQRLMRF
jgi:hypothetical protein